MNRNKAQRPILIAAFLAAMTGVDGYRRAVAAENRLAVAKVAQALQAETSGNNSRREALLETALQEAPNCEAARWQSGYVRCAKRWVRFDEVPELVARDGRLATYRKVREKYPENIDGQMALAAWCEKNGLHEQCRAHLGKVLEMNPDHAEARRLLGYRMVNGDWLTPDDLAQAAGRAAKTAAAVKEWEPKLRAILSDLQQGSRKQQDRAAKEWQGLSDPAASPAVELVLCTGSSEPAALKGVEKLSELPGNESAVSLARQAVFSPWPQVRQAAANGLKPRDWETFVPVLLSAMRSPIQTRIQFYSDFDSGRLLYRHIFFREGQSRNEVAVLDSGFTHLTPPDRGPTGQFDMDSLARNVQAETQAAKKAVQCPDGSQRWQYLDGRRFLRRPDGTMVLDLNPEPMKAVFMRNGRQLSPQEVNAYSQAVRQDEQNRKQYEQTRQRAAILNQFDRQERMRQAAVGMGSLARARETAVARDNAATQSLDERVVWVLSTATGVSLPCSPDACWQWWADTIDVYVSGYKPTDMIYRKSHQTACGPDLVGPPPQPLAPPMTYEVGNVALLDPPRTASCLVAGTAVWTESGPVAIDKIKAGDLVLAQNVETGELVYKPVLQTTVRLANKTVKLQLLDDTIRCSLGHPFWIAGRGWTMAKEIAPGSNFHGVEGTTPLRQIELSTSEPVYNLIVADFHTYFVGKALVLSHDTTAKRPTNVVVPGLAAR
jgi:hypothetical protein